jgi:hypothetical protein
MTILERRVDEVRSFFTMTTAIDLYHTLFNSAKVSLAAAKEAFDFLVSVHDYSDDREWSEQIQYTDLWRVLSIRAYERRRIAPPRPDPTTRCEPLMFEDTREAGIITSSSRQYVLFQSSMLMSMALNICQSELFSIKGKNNHLDRAGVQQVRYHNLLSICETALRRVFDVERVEKTRNACVIERGKEDVVVENQRVRNVRRLQLRIICCFSAGVLDWNKGLIQDAVSYWNAGKILFSELVDPSLCGAGDTMYHALITLVYHSTCIAYFVTIGENDNTDDSKLKTECYNRAISLGWKPLPHVREVNIKEDDEKDHIVAICGGDHGEEDEDEEGVIKKKTSRLSIPKSIAPKTLRDPFLTGGYDTDGRGDAEYRDSLSLLGVS